MNELRTREEVTKMLKTAEQKRQIIEKLGPEHALINEGMIAMLLWFLKMENKDIVEYMKKTFPKITEEILFEDGYIG